MNEQSVRQNCDIKLVSFFSIYGYLRLSTVIGGSRTSRAEVSIAVSSLLRTDLFEEICHQRRWPLDCWVGVASGVLQLELDLLEVASDCVG